MKAVVISGEKRKELLTKSLQDLAPEVNEKDKALAIIQLDTSLSTINKYLKGDVSNMAFADALHNLLRCEVLKRRTAA